MDVLARNNVKVFGRGTQPMLFAHGFGCDQNMWRFMTPAFEADYRIVLFDYVGSGKSDLGAYAAERYATLDGYAQDLLDIVHALDLHDVIFVGHSVSSMVGVLAANREPERFARLVLVGPSPRYVNDPPYVGGFERGVARRVVGAEVGLAGAHVIEEDDAIVGLERGRHEPPHVLVTAEAVREEHGLRAAPEDLHVVASEDVHFSWESRRARARRDAAHA